LACGGSRNSGKYRYRVVSEKNSKERSRRVDLDLRGRPHWIRARGMTFLGGEFRFQEPTFGGVSTEGV